MTSDIVNIKSYASIAAAELGNSLLKEYGIIGMVEKRGLRFPGDLGDSYGVDLFVHERDTERAREILETPGK